MDKVEREVILKQMAAYRREHFAVEVEPNRESPAEPGEVVLSVTYNGNQWRSISLNPSERLAVIAALQAVEEPVEEREARIKKGADYLFKEMCGDHDEVNR